MRHPARAPHRPLLQLIRGRHPANPTDLPVIDLPRRDAEAIAATVQHPGDHPSLRPGKGTHLHPIATGDATVIPMVRQRPSGPILCGGCGRDVATCLIRPADRSAPAYLCEGCRAAGAPETETGGGDAA